MLMRNWLNDDKFLVDDNAMRGYEDGNDCKMLRDGGAKSGWKRNACHPVGIELVFRQRGEA